MINTSNGESTIRRAGLRSVQTVIICTVAFFIPHFAVFLNFLGAISGIIFFKKISFHIKMIQKIIKRNGIAIYLANYYVSKTNKNKLYRKSSKLLYSCRWHSWRSNYCHFVNQKPGKL